MPSLSAWLAGTPMLWFWEAETCVCPPPGPGAGVDRGESRSTDGPLPFPRGGGDAPWWAGIVGKVGTTEPRRAFRPGVAG